MKKRLLQKGFSEILLLTLILITALSWMAITQLPKNRHKEQGATLNVLAKNVDVEIGAYAAKDRLGEQRYREILLEQFGFIVIDGQPNWTFEDGTLRPSEKDFDFTRLDALINFSERNSKPVQVHHYVWGEEKWLPAWLKDGNYSQEQLLSLIENHIKTVGGRYRGRVREWTVVNEAFTRGNTRPDIRDWWGDRLRKDYINKAFIWAKDADPNSKLILNDFNNETKGPVSDAMYEFIKQMKQNNVPIDGLGMQMHIDGTKPPKKEEVVANMRRFGDLGVKVYVTEFDVNMNDVAGDKRHKEQKQAQIYTDMLAACLESGVCPSFAYLGITDKESWYNELGVPEAMPLFFDKNYNPKPAYYAIKETLTEASQ